MTPAPAHTPPKLLSNFEVYQLLKERAAKSTAADRKRRGNRQQPQQPPLPENVGTVIFEVIHLNLIIHAEIPV